MVGSSALEYKVIAEFGSMEGSVVTSVSWLNRSRSRQSFGSGDSTIVEPNLDLERVEADELPDLAEGHSALGDQPAGESLFDEGRLPHNVLAGVKSRGDVVRRSRATR